MENVLWVLSFMENDDKKQNEDVCQRITKHSP